MDNRISSDFSKKELQEEKVAEVKEEEVLPLQPKKQAKIVNIMNDQFILEDEDGNGITFPISSEYKKYKIGDVIKL